jgi:hypothetical protein
MRGEGLILTKDAIDAMQISDQDKKKIFGDAARKLMRLPT